MKRSLVAVAAALCCIVGTVRADLIDPADLHVFSSTSFSQSSGGTDWITLPTFNGTFDLEDISNKAGLSILPWHIVFAVPDFTGTLVDTINTINGTTVNLSPGPEATLTSGSAYIALGVSGADHSVSFANFLIADAALGVSPPTSFGLYDFEINLAGLALLDKTPFDISLSGLLPTGTIVFGYGSGNDGKLYDSAFTNAGVVSTLAAPTPEPSTLAIGMLGATGMVIASRWLNRHRKVA